MLVLGFRGGGGGVREGARTPQGVTNISRLFRTGRVESIRDALLKSTLYLPVLEEVNYCAGHPNITLI